MPLTAPRGGLSLAGYRLALTLANCAEWIGWTGSLNAAAAITRVYFHGTPLPADNRDRYTREELQQMRPFAVVFMEERGGGYEIEVIAERGWQDSGRLHVVIEDNVAEAIRNDTQEIQRQFEGRIGAVLGTEDGVTGLVDLAGLAPDEDHIYLDIRKIRCYGPFRADDDERAGQGDHVYMLLTIDWGQR